jgi:cysteine desulfurase
VYLDYNATTPVDPRVEAAMRPYLIEHFGNPSSGHSFGARPARSLAQARVQVAALIGSEPEEVIFTGSGTEADAMAIRGVVLAAVEEGQSRPHVVTQATEHPAVLAACRYVHRFHGANVTVLPVDRFGLVDPDLLRSAVTAETVLVSVMHANNETGIIQDLTELVTITHQRGAMFHTDAAQSVGKLAVDVNDLGVDLLTLVGHKMYAPKGVAALYLRRGRRLQPLLAGGGQEQDLRAGTENVAGVVGLGHAAMLATDDLAAGAPGRLAALRDRLHAALVQRLPGRVHLNGHPSRRLAHVLNVSIDQTVAHDVLAASPMLAASTGSACHAGHRRPSPVLLAMGCDEHRAMSAFRFSLGRWSTAAEVDYAAAVLSAAAL